MFIGFYQFLTIHIYFFKSLSLLVDSWSFFFLLAFSSLFLLLLVDSQWIKWSLIHHNFAWNTTRSPTKNNFKDRLLCYIASLFGLKRHLPQSIIGKSMPILAKNGRIQNHNGVVMVNHLWTEMLKAWSAIYEQPEYFKHRLSPVLLLVSLRSLMNAPMWPFLKPCAFLPFIISSSFWHISSQDLSTILMTFWALWKAEKWAFWPFSGFLWISRNWEILIWTIKSIVSWNLVLAF